VAVMRSSFGMSEWPRGLALSIGLALLAGGCGGSDTAPVGEEGWLKGDAQQKLDTVAKHLRGTDVAMIEMDYRYGELYWAGEDANWDYAAYQLEKLRLALDLGLERRPPRARSAALFKEQALPPLATAIRSEDQEAFRRAFSTLTTHCNACHAMEQMPFLHVGPPERRVSNVQQRSAE
jgi:hypothetical protein